MYKLMVSLCLYVLHTYGVCICFTSGAVREVFLLKTMLPSPCLRCTVVHTCNVCMDAGSHHEQLILIYVRTYVYMVIIYYVRICVCTSVCVCDVEHVCMLLCFIVQSNH